MSTMVCCISHELHSRQPNKPLLASLPHCCFVSFCPFAQLLFQAGQLGKQGQGILQFKDSDITTSHGLNKPELVR